MSLCRLYIIDSVGTRPLSWTCVPREKSNVVARASRGRSTTRSERLQSSRPEDDSEGDGSGVNPLWDSNVESVRRRNRNRTDARDSSSPLSASQTISTPDWLTPKKEWTFNPQEPQTKEKGTKPEPEPEPEPEEQRPWWKPSKANYDYDDGEPEDEGEEDYEDDEDYDGLDMKSDQLFSSLRWGIPLSFVILPWLLGNPVVVLLGLAAVPAVQRAVGPVVNQAWRAFVEFGGPPQEKRRRNKAKTYESGSDEGGEDPYSSWGGERDTAQPYRYKKPASGELYNNNNNNNNVPADSFLYSDVIPANKNRPSSRQGSKAAGQSVSMGGWEDLEADRRGRMPVRRPKRSSKLGWRSRKKEKPLFVRLLVALFPFLRNWGGWLSIFLFSPFLTVVENSHFR